MCDSKEAFPFKCGLLQISKEWNFVISISAFEEGFTNSWRGRILIFFFLEQSVVITMEFNLHMKFSALFLFPLFTPLVSGPLNLIFYPSQSFLNSQLTFFDGHSLARAGAGLVGLLVFWGLRRNCKSTQGTFTRKVV